MFVSFQESSMIARFDPKAFRLRSLEISLEMYHRDISIEEIWCRLWNNGSSFGTRSFVTLGAPCARDIMRIFAPGD